MNLFHAISGNDETGFTLIELLVVIGILAALVSVAIPAYIWAYGEGDTDANLAEFSNVQTAMHAMMTYHQLQEIDPNESPTNQFHEQPTVGAAPPADTTGDGISDNFEYLSPTYMKVGGTSNPTKCYYTWDTKGILTQVACN